MSLRDACRGSASVEIVVMLPLFIILFAGIYHLHALGVLALDNAERARGCAWQFAVQGCEAASTGDLCEGVSVAKDADVKRESDARAAGGDETAAELEKSKSVLDQVADIPILGGLVEALFGEGAVAALRRQTAGFMGEEEVTLQKSYYVVCNTVAKSWSDLMKDQVCAVITGNLGLDGTVVGCE